MVFFLLRCSLFQRELFKLLYLVKNDRFYQKHVPQGNGKAPREEVWRILMKCLCLWNGGTLAAIGKEACGNSRWTQSFTFQPQVPFYIFQHFKTTCYDISRCTFFFSLEFVNCQIKKENKSNPVASLNASNNHLENTVKTQPVYKSNKNIKYIRMN